MEKQLSFIKYEHKVLPRFRERMSRAESTEDVKKFYVYTVKELFKNIFGEKLKFHYEDVRLKPNDTPPFVLSEHLFTNEDLSSAWDGSDLRRVICRLAESATRRHRHLEKHREKTDAKIRM